MVLTKFRGKTYDGRWVYGLPTYISEENYDDGIIDGIKVHFDTVEDVKPNTVSIFTEQEDKASIKIYSGDIMKVELPMGGFWGNVKREEIGEVMYEPDYAAFVVRWKYSKNQHHVVLNCDTAFFGKVIGNITDNPELLKA